MVYNEVQDDIFSSSKVMRHSVLGPEATLHVDEKRLTGHEGHMSAHFNKAVFTVRPRVWIMFWTRSLRLWSKTTITTTTTYTCQYCKNNSINTLYKILKKFKQLTLDTQISITQQWVAKLKRDENSNARMGRRSRELKKIFSKFIIVSKFISFRVF